MRSDIKRSELEIRLPAALVIAASLAAAPLRAQGVPTVVVMDFSSFMMGEGGASVDLGKAISAMLVTELGEHGGVRVVERGQLNELMRKRDPGPHGAMEEADAIEVGRMLGVQYVVHGQVTSIVDNLRLDIRAVDVESSEIVSIMKKSAQTTELFAVVAELADEFGGALDLAPAPARPSLGPVPIRATVEFSRAVSYEDEGAIDLALRHYRATLELHPEHRDARRALERLGGAS